eukprot:13523740-Alexandrium_andersonii.AAC.1
MQRGVRQQRAAGSSCRAPRGPAGEAAGDVQSEGESAHLVRIAREAIEQAGAAARPIVAVGAMLHELIDARLCAARTSGLLNQQDIRRARNCAGRGSGLFLAHVALGVAPGLRARN